MEDLLYVIPSNTPKEKILSDLKAHPEIQFVSLVGLDLARLVLELTQRTAGVLAGARQAGPAEDEERENDQDDPFPALHVERHCNSLLGVRGEV